ncbi:MAG: hypothetical protein ABSF90_20900 [Syntrophobacteraceae bacterium]
MKMPQINIYRINPADRVNMPENSGIKLNSVVPWLWNGSLCDGCNREPSELDPFGKSGDPICGDHEGKVLVKTLRPIYQPNKKFDELIESYFKDCETGEDFTKALKCIAEPIDGQMRYVLMQYVKALDEADVVWLCRACIIKTDEEYFRYIPKYTSTNEIYKADGYLTSEIYPTEDHEDSDDTCCACCRKHISELEPFGKCFGPWKEDRFDGKFLVRCFRPICKSTPELDALLKKFYEAHEEDEEGEPFISKYGQKKYDMIRFYESIEGTEEEQPLCRACCLLDNDGFWARYEKRDR